MDTFVTLILVTLAPAFFCGIVFYFVIRCGINGFYTVKPNERAVITSFGKAKRLNVLKKVQDESGLSSDEKERYDFPQVVVVKPGGPYFKWPWQKVHKVNVATQAKDITWDPTKEQLSIEAVTKDNLTTGVRGQIRYQASESHLYAFLFGVQSPLEHIMGYFISILRERIANFVDPRGKELVTISGDDSSLAESGVSEGVSINDLRKNLPLLNQFMEEQCANTAARYGIELDAALITEIDPPEAVDRALAAINSTRNQVAADISTAQADADQQITLSKRAVEIATNNAEAEVAPLLQLAETLKTVKAEGGSEGLLMYLRNMRVPLMDGVKKIYNTQRTREGK